MKLAHKRELIEIMPLRFLYSDYSEHHRLKVFVNKGRKCVVCGRVGWLLLTTRDKDGQEHVDLYTEDFVLMTVDHTIPKAICKKESWPVAKRESLANKEPMCDPCNSFKGCRVISPEELRTQMAKKAQATYGPEIIRQLVFNNNIFDRSLEGI